MMRSSLVAILVCFLCLGCKSNKESVTNIEKPCVPNTEESCVCTTEYNPVCGCDNKTYPNPCHAQCSNVTYVLGKCKDKK